jgi:phage gp46-like protein
MIGVALVPYSLLADLALGPRGLVDDPTPATAALLSLLTDRRAGPNDQLPDPNATDRRGWCGDALAWVDGDQFGSRLWLLSRAKQTEETRCLAIDYAQEALAWMITDGAATAVAVQAAWAQRGWLALTVTITLPGGGQIVTPLQIPIGGS